MEKAKYPWYEIVDNNEPILQGDFFLSCPVFVPATDDTSIKEDATVPVEVIQYDVIVMSQSCDLLQKKIELVLVCPVWSLNEFESRNDFFKSKKGKNSLRQGNVPVSTDEIIEAVKKMKKADREAFIEDLLAITSPEYLQSVKEARSEYKAGKTKSHKEIFG